MHSSDWSRLLTERQREVLSIVVENKVYRNRDSKIPELAAQMGIAPAAVAKHLLEIEKTALLNVVVSPSEQGKRVYERLELEPRPEQKQTAEVLDWNTVTIRRFLHGHPDASVTEGAEELGFSEYTTRHKLRCPERGPRDSRRPASDLGMSGSPSASPARNASCRTGPGSTSPAFRATRSTARCSIDGSSMARWTMAPSCAHRPRSPGLRVTTADGGSRRTARRSIRAS